jgi:hypothetical protein
MLDRAPTYYLGTSLDEPAEAQRSGMALIARLMELSGTPMDPDGRTDAPGGGA